MHFRILQWLLSKTTGTAGESEITSWPVLQPLGGNTEDYIDYRASAQVAKSSSRHSRICWVFCLVATQLHLPREEPSCVTGLDAWELYFPECLPREFLVRCHLNGSQVPVGAASRQPSMNHACRPQTSETPVSGFLPLLYAAISCNDCQQGLHFPDLSFLGSPTLNGLLLQVPSVVSLLQMELWRVCLVTMITSSGVTKSDGLIGSQALPCTACASLPKTALTSVSSSVERRQKNSHLLGIL